MSVTSMTGFARSAGANDAARWVWEVKSVNGKSLDVRFRLPGGFETIEQAARLAATGMFGRGSFQIGLQLQRNAPRPAVKVNVALLNEIVAAAEAVATRADVAAPRLDGLLAIPGVIETETGQEDDKQRAALEAALLASLDEALQACVAMRRREGEELGEILLRRIDEIEALTQEAESNPVRQPEAIRERLQRQIADLVDASSALDPARLHQEALLLAARSDIREELDRLFAHCRQARSLLTAGGAVGRKLDFLAQEFNREANTLCSKSIDVSLTAIGMALKATIDQFREQVQNIE